MDPESEALIRQLHRDLNGLRTSRRGGNPQELMSLDSLKRARDAKLDSSGPNRRREDHRTGSRRGSPHKRRKVHQARDGSASDEESDYSRSSATSSSSQSHSDTQTGPAKRHRGDARGSKERPGHKHGVASKELRRSIDDAPPVPRQRKAENPVQPRHAHKQDTAAQQDGHAPSAAAPCAEQPAQQDAAQQPSAVPATPLEAAAAAASLAVKEQAKQLHISSRPSPGQRLVKCFHAGVRWGIKLSPQALQTRSDLATALNDAFAGEILSCGRGETLTIVTLDSQGRATEFPALRGPGSRGKDSATKWKAMVESAVKIYVRRS